MPIIKLLGQVHRATCAADGCDWRMGGLKKVAAEEALDKHMLEHTLTDIVAGICVEVGYTPTTPLRVQIWASLVREHDGDLGQARYEERLIVLEAKWVGTERMEDTLRHEIAHFLAFDRWGHGGHGEQWKTACAIVGAVPEPSKMLTAAESAVLYPRKWARWERYLADRGRLV
jgi:hypothetical protein